MIKKNDPIEARKKLGIENIPTILIMMGSMGYGNIKKIFGTHRYISERFSSAVRLRYE